MNAQIPLPSFDDIRKILHFWIDQQDKWFYFETNMMQSGIGGVIQKAPSQMGYGRLNNKDITSEQFQYSQTRIVGKIHNIVEYPPSLLLQDVTIFTVELEFPHKKGNVVDVEKRNQYGLVFSQVAYYEPIKDFQSFVANDSRIK